MTTTVSAPGTEAAPRRPAIDRAAAEQLMSTEYSRVVEQLQSLTDDDWLLPTCNTGWDIRSLAAHMLGMVAMAASVPEQLRQMRAARKRGGEFIDALTGVQVDKYAAWTPQQLIAEYARLAPKATKGRARMPGLLRSRKMPDDQPVNPPHEYEPWTFAYLVDVILTRDPWLHRSDIATATGRPLVLTAEHDGAIIADVVREWAERHKQPYTLTLTGVAGGSWEAGTGGPSYTLDAIEFCRILSGRGAGDGLLRTRVPF